MKRILVATDFSPCAKAALDQAVKIAAATGAQLTLMHTHSLPAYVLPDGTVFALDSVAAREIEKSIEGQLALERQRAGVSMELLCVEGNPAESVLSQAAKGGFDLLVMGTHGRTGVRRLLLGSIAERVLRSAPCPMMVVRDPT
jgi:nucleotide-binding universal stress UspA family protein